VRPTGRYSVVENYNPQSTITAYKLFRIDPRKPGKLFPLFVNANEEVSVGQWLEAEAGSHTESGKVKSKLGPLAYGPGRHMGDLPIATHRGSCSNFLMLWYDVIVAVLPLVLVPPISSLSYSNSTHM